MKLSAQEEYGLRCLLQMASHGDEASLSIPEISRAEGLSVPNVAKLMRLLRMSGYVKSVRGQSGGYRLARPPQEIVVGSVLESLGGRLYSNRFCRRHAGLLDECVHDANCSMKVLWSGLQNMLDKVLFKVTLADLMQPESTMYGMLAERHGDLILAETLRAKSTTA